MSFSERLAPYSPAETYNTAPDELYAAIGGIVELLGYHVEDVELATDKEGNERIEVRNQMLFLFNGVGKPITAKIRGCKRRTINSYNDLTEFITSTLGKKR